MLVTLDFETYYDSKVSLTKLTTMDYVKHDLFKVQGVGIKIDQEETEYYDEHEAEAAIHDIDWSDVSLVCHNTPFDGYILTRYYGVIPRYYIDTAAIARALAPGLSASLKDTAIRLFPDDESMRKGDELASTKGIYDLDPELSDTLGRYCIQDVDLTYALYNQMYTRMPKSEMDLIDMTCRMFCEPKLIADREALIKFRDETIAKSEAAIAAGGIDRKVLSSNQQFAEHIISMGIVPPTKPSPTSGKDIPALGKSDKAFTQLQKMYPEHQHIWDARLAAKSRINETRAQRFIDATHADGTISVPLRYYAAHTGRYGGTEKINMQNMPRKSPLRLALTSPKDHLVFVADLSNIEARMLAWLADENDLLDQFRAGDDIYSNLATRIYNRPIDKKKDPTERFVGKTAVLGLGYGMGAPKFQATLEAGAMGPPMKFTTNEAYDVVNTYRTTYPGIPMLWKKLELKLANTINHNYEEEWHGLIFKDKKIYLPNGLALHYNNLRFSGGKLTYDSRHTESTWGGRIAENVVQALSRIIVTDAMLRIQKDTQLQADVVLTVHDEIVLISHANNPDATMSTLIKHMCTPPSWALDIPLDAEGGYDTRYSK
jgi:DNA polymerase|tara:strand:+ start:3032 stop:4834 length:1803 start_codon:yes stop_codon:yes gene_type:complete